MPRTSPAVAGARSLILLVGIAACASAGSARAESALRLERPPSIGTIPAATFDTERHRVGEAHLVLEELENGQLRMLNDSGFRVGARTVMQALLAPVDGGLRPVFQESRSFDGEGHPMGVLTVDHAAGKARCAGPDGVVVHEVALPAGDRVANVPLNLLFLPVVRGRREEVSFQIFLCSAGGKLMDFVASLAPHSRNGNGSGRPVEVRYGPDFGIATLVARSFVPKLSLWFQPEEPYAWVGHRVPLYGKGPEVFVVRDGVPVEWLGDD